MTSSRRDQLIDTALDLFLENGFHATGIDRILAEAGVAKMTLYKHFRSKDELILAALKRRDERFLAWFMDAVERLGGTPRDRLLGIFDALGEWFSAKDFRGCLFINASAEFGQPDNPIREAAREHKRLVFNYVRGLTAAADARDAESLAKGLCLLMEGAIVMARVANETDSAGQARRAARVLIAEAGI